MSIETGKWYAFLDESINNFDEILFFEDKLISVFLQLEGSLKLRGKILVLSLVEAPTISPVITFHQLTREEAEMLTALYYTYEFSDNFLLLSQDNTAYASLYNFVRTGVLSMEEFFEALLC